MSPSLATIIFSTGIAGLFFFDRDKKVGVSKALWIPTLWMFFCLSRSASQWLGISPPPADMASIYLEGSPIDRVVFMGLEIAALIVIVGRQRRVISILRQNWAICLFFSYAAFSITWSDYPFVSLKHWIKGIGDLMMVLIVLTEQNVPEAIKRLFTRLGFLLLPLSVLFFKYYPQLGRVLDLSWIEEPVGVATQKNSLGELCDFLGLALLWRFRGAYNDREDRNRIRRLVALAAVLAMAVWLLWMCDSMTSICAVSMASIVMLLSMTRAFRRRPVLVHVLVIVLLSSTIYALFFQSSGDLIQSLGRNPTLTGRTDIWKLVLSIPSDPVLGVGYESFWLGARLQRIWNAVHGLRLNESHSGYIEIVITLGWIGVGLLGCLIATGYRNVIDAFRRDPDIGSLRMAFFLATIITGLTEAAFRMMGPPWIVFLLAIAAAPCAKHKIDPGARRGSRLLWSAGECVVVGEEASVG
ncbi:MAG TPA: O-antigen ligase family protein [Candidatus Sulfotelmatobacter sp.]|nr:O-antigen ligase family protein [Candidatus Sulfotelmatobacter sp.]